jgi:hypothetical protein
LASVTIADFVDSVVDAGRDSRFDDVIVVGHSMAGLTLPGVAEDLGADTSVRQFLRRSFHP